jgi:hypothetical protein
MDDGADGMRKRPEDAIQRAVMAHFAARPAGDVFAFHVPNGGGWSAIEAAILKGLGVKAGVPDIIAIKGGHSYALELKADGNKPTPTQSETMAAMQRAGATVAAAVGLDAALAQLEAWGLLRGRAV